MLYFFSPVASQLQKQDVAGEGGRCFHQDKGPVAFVDLLVP